jgi:hypothetical protein
MPCFDQQMQKGQEEVPASKEFGQEWKRSSHWNIQTAQYVNIAFFLSLLSTPLFFAAREALTIELWHKEAKLDGIRQNASEMFLPYPANTSARIVLIDSKPKFSLFADDIENLLLQLVQND